MKKILLGLLACGLSANLAMAEATWLTSLPKAQEQAKKENKLVLLDFTGSDWCPWCIKMDKETYSKAEFEDYAKKNLVLVLVDFPAQKPQSDELKAANKALGSKYNITGYPTQVIVKPDGTVVWENVGYLEGGPSALITAVEKAKTKGSRS